MVGVGDGAGEPVGSPVSVGSTATCCGVGAAVGLEAGAAHAASSAAAVTISSIVFFIGIPLLGWVLTDEVPQSIVGGLWGPVSPDEPGIVLPLAGVCSLIPKIVPEYWANVIQA